MVKVFKRFVSDHLELKTNLPNKLQVFNHEGSGNFVMSELIVCGFYILNIS